MDLGRLEPGNYEDLCIIMAHLGNVLPWGGQRRLGNMKLGAPVGLDQSEYVVRRTREQVILQTGGPEPVYSTLRSQASRQ